MTNSAVPRYSPTTLAARLMFDQNKTAAEAARVLGLKLHYAQSLYATWRGDKYGEARRDTFLPTRDADARFVRKVMAQGGLPRIVHTPKLGAVWVSPQDRPWRHLKAKAA